MRDVLGAFWKNERMASCGGVQVGQQTWPQERGEKTEWKGDLCFEQETFVLSSRGGYKRADSRDPF